MADIDGSLVKLNDAIDTVEKSSTKPMVDSTSDDRTVNNLMRHAYRVLSDDEEKAMQEIKDMGLAFWQKIESLGVSWSFRSPRPKKP